MDPSKDCSTSTGEAVLGQQTAVELTLQGQQLGAQQLQVQWQLS
jgi:hypothetical protein